MLLYESAFLTTLKQKDAVEITQMMANFLSNWLASGPQLPARLPGDSVATNGDSVKKSWSRIPTWDLWEVIYAKIYPGNFQLFWEHYSQHKNPSLPTLTNLQLFWEQKMGDRQVELIPYLMKEPLKLLQV